MLPLVLAHSQQFYIMMFIMLVRSVAFWVTNPCRITRKEFLMKQTKMYVCTLEEFILVDVVTLLYMDELNCIGKCCSLYTVATMDEKG